MNRTAWLAGIVGLAVGAAVGYQLAPRTQNSAAQNIAVSNTVAKPEPATAVFAKVSDPKPAVFDNLSEADLRSSVTKLAKRPQNKANKDLLTRALQTWTRKNPLAAWQWALAQPSDLSRQRLHTVISEWVKTNPNAAISAAQILTFAQHRDGVLSHAFLSWAAIDFHSALKAVKALADTIPNTEDMAASLIQNTGMRDPMLALAAVSSLRHREARKVATVTIIESWAKTNTPAALAAAQKIQDSEIRRLALVKAYSAWTQKDLKSSMAAIERDPDPTTRQTALKDALSLWFSKEPFAAAEYIAEQGDAKLIPSASGDPFAETATPQEVDRLLSLLPAGKDRDDFTRRAAMSEIRRGQYPRAVDLLNKTADSLQRDNQLYNLGRAWTTGHPQTLDPWLRQQHESPDRDLVTLGMVNQLARDTPRSALPWLSFITDPTARLAATKNVAHHWISLEPVAGQAWISQGSGLLPDQQTKVLENVGRNYVDYAFDDYLSTRWPPSQ